MSGRKGSSAIIVAMCLGVFGRSATAFSAPSPTVETLRMHAGPDEPEYRLDVEKDSRSENTPRLAIVSAGHRSLVSVEGGLVPIREALVEPSLSSRNTLHSKFVFTAPPMPENMIVVFGYAFASDPGAIRIIRLRGASAPEQILSDDTFQLTDIRGDADGHSLLVIGHRSLSQSNGECLTTYDPYSVFKLSDRANGRFQYSLALSKAYNLAHYAGWAGPDAREDIAVNRCKGRIVPLPRSEPR